MVSTADGSAPVSFPERVGRYELLLPLGTGGMATVFLARGGGVGGFERDVALKLLHAHLRADEESKQHLLEEAKLAARIRHPNVVPVLEANEDPFGLYLVMDYIEGEALSGLLSALRKNGVPLPSRIAARVMLDALAGLHAAHELRADSGAPLGLVHRDFSPQNLLIGIDGVARLTDFGVAKAAGRAVRTKTGLVKGKVAYMAPEQARGHEVDRRCDVWAAGVIAWELISGQRLHDNPDDVATLLSVVTEEPPLLSEVMASVDPRLEQAVASALSIPVSERCPTAEELRSNLETAWRNNGGIADQRELGAFVAAALGPDLARRRDQLMKVRELRAQVGEIVRANNNRTSEPANARTVIGLGAMASSVPPAAARNTIPIPEPSLTTSTVLTTESHTLTVAARERRATVRRLWVSAAVATTVIAGLLLMARLQAAHTPDSRLADSAPAVQAPPAPAITAKTETAEEKPRDDERVNVPRDSEQRMRSNPTAMRSPAPSARPRPVRRISRRPNVARKATLTQERAEPESKAPNKLADDPYGQSQ